MSKQSYPNTIIRVSPEVFEELKDLQMMTRRPIGEIASEALKYAMENICLVEVKTYDVTFGECEGRKKDK